MEDTTLEAAAAPSGRGEHTRRQLLRSATMLFAERGFRGASIRDIAKAAGCNVASVNYYFGSKEHLYEEAFRRNQIAAQERGVAAAREVVRAARGKPTLEAVLKAFVEAGAASDTAGEARSFKMLIHRELVEPQLDPRFLLHEILEPLERGLGEAIRAACPGLGAKDLNRSLHSFLAQISHYRSLHAYFGSLGAERLPMLDEAEAIRHIVRFTAAGMRSFQKRKT